MIEFSSTKHLQGMLKEYIIVKKIDIDQLVASLLCHNQNKILAISVQAVTPEKENRPEKIFNFKLSVTNLSNYKTGKEFMEFKGVCITSRKRFTATINNGSSGKYGTIALLPMTSTYTPNNDNGR